MLSCIWLASISCYCEHALALRKLKCVCEPHRLTPFFHYHVVPLPLSRRVSGIFTQHILWRGCRIITDSYPWLFSSSKSSSSSTHSRFVTSLFSRIWIFFKAIRWDMAKLFLPTAMAGVVLGVEMPSYLEPMYLELCMSLFLISNLPWLFRKQERKPYCLLFHHGSSEWSVFWLVLFRV